MNQLQAITLRFHDLTHPKFITPLTSCLGSISRARMAVGALALGLGMFAGAFNSQAQNSNFWIAGDGNWSDNSSWSAGAPPAITDDADFTNAAVYTVHFTADASITSNLFANSSGTVATVTMDMGAANQFSPGGNFVVGTQANASNTVYIASNSQPGFAPKSGAAITVGRNGVGTLIVTNGQVGPSPPAYGITAGNGNGGSGHIVVSGSSSVILCSTFQLGSSSNGEGNCTLVISNGGRFQTSSSVRIGSGSGSVSTNNHLTVYSGSVFIYDAGPLVIGARSVAPLTGTFACVDNTIVIKTGGLMQCGVATRRSIVIGDANFTGQASTGPNISTNNSLTIEFGGSVTQASVVQITPTNALNQLGGYFDCGSITNYGTMTAWGANRGSIIITNGGTLRVPTSQGRFSITNGLFLVNTATLEMELGTSFPSGPLGGIDCGSIVISNLSGSGTVATLTTNGATALLGTLNFTDSGGFAPGTYTILSYTPSPTVGTPTNFTWAGTIGTVPNNTFTYAIDTNTIGKVKLIVTGPAPTIPFRIISVAKSGNDVALTWTAPASVINRVQATLGTLPGGNFNTNGFTDITGDITTAASGTNTFTDTNGATNKPARYYRVRQP